MKRANRNWQRLLGYTGTGVLEPYRYEVLAGAELLKTQRIIMTLENLTAKIYGLFWAKAITRVNRRIKKSFAEKTLRFEDYNIFWK